MSAIAAIAAGSVCSERYTGQVRWRRNFVGFDEVSPVLQQAVEVTEYQDGRPYAQRIEWRDVPTVTETDK